MKPNKLEQKIVNLIAPRLQDEYDAFYHYRAVSNYCKNVGFKKASEYFANESSDELNHAKKLEDYLVDWNVTPPLPEIPNPTLEFKSLLDCIEQSYKIEFMLYGAYEETAKEMFKADLCTFKLMQDMIQIQLKSIAEYSDMLNILEGVEATKINFLLLEETLF